MRETSWLCVPLAILAVLATDVRSDGRYERTSIYYTEPTTRGYANFSSVDVINSNGNGNGNNGGLYELRGGYIVRDQRLLTRSRSPYLLREDLFVEKNAELVIESGVEIRFGPMVGITVRGIITAKVIIRKNNNNDDDDDNAKEVECTLRRRKVSGRFSRSRSRTKADCSSGFCTPSVSHELRNN